MFRALAKRIVGARTEDMDRYTYRVMVRRVEDSLKEAAAAVLSIILVIVMSLMFVMALVQPEPGYYAANPNGEIIDGVAYHWHDNSGCDICD